MRHKCKFKLTPCQLLDAFKCNIRRGFNDKLACQCPCHVKAKAKRNAEFLTPDTLLTILLTGDQDTITCNACGVVKVITFEVLEGAEQTVENGKRMSLVMTGAGRRQIIKKFKEEHLESCLELSKKQIREAMTKK